MSVKSQVTSRPGRTRPATFDLSKNASEEIDVILGPTALREQVLEYLLRLRDHFGGVTDAMLARLAIRLNVSQAELYELATFYPAVGYASEAIIPAVEVCDDLACALRSTPELTDSLRRGASGVEICRPGACSGACDRAPVVRRKGIALQPSASSTAWRQLGQYRASGGYAVLDRLRIGEKTADDILALIGQADMRGRAGTAFPVAQKWQAMRERRSGGRGVVIVNADEGELATFKDRYILEQDPHGALEGAVVAARVVEASRVIIYLRDDYRHLYPIVSAAMSELGATNHATGLSLELRRSGGAFICGEETALIASLEGRVARPREKPPYPTVVGLNGLPTLVHNVETFYRVRAAWGLAMEPDIAVTALLAPDATIFSVSGRVNQPGVQIVRSPHNLSAVVDAAGGVDGGREFGGVVLGGSAGAIVPAQQCELPIFELARRGIGLGTGSVIVFARDDDMREIATKMASFLARESCGQCTPCRVGTRKMVELLGQRNFNLGLATDLAFAMREASICGLGRSAGRFLARVADIAGEGEQ